MITEQSFNHHHQTAIEHQQQGKHLQAVLQFDAALDLTTPEDFPHYAEVAMQRFVSAWQAFKDGQDHADWRHFDRLQRLVSMGVTSGAWFVGESTLAAPELSNLALLNFTRRHAEQVAARMPTLIPHFDFNARAKNKKIRLGFVGCDFFQQATAYLLNAAVREIDREHFEVMAYDHGAPIPMDDFRRQSLQAYDRITPIDSLTDEAAAQLIFDDGIDVLFNIKNPASSRLGIFMQRPAPIQIHYLYFPGTSGMPFFDYIVADNVVIPPALEFGYCEKVLRIEDCYQPNDPARPHPLPSSRADWGLPDDAVVLANMSQSYKITPHMFELWCRLLHMDKRRVLWLLDSNKIARKNLTREAQMRGIDPSRIYFSPALSTQQHFTRLTQADIVIDTYPYGGHTLTSDALWAGTPIVTRAGETFASRVAASLLTSVGLPELVANFDDDYVRIIDQLANDKFQRDRYQKHLESGRSSFALFNAKSYAKRFGAMIKNLFVI